MEFPTTQWTNIEEAGNKDPQALQRFATRYRGVVQCYLQDRGLASHDAEDVCQDVFVRLLKGNVLAGAQAQRGRFRSLLLTITQRALIDHWRRQRPRAQRAEAALESRIAEDHSRDFDYHWAMGILERALARLRTEDTPHYAQLAAHLGGEGVDRRKLWLARERLHVLMRGEVAATCTHHDIIQDELAHLTRLLRPRRSNAVTHH